MNLVDKLQNIGISRREAEVYLALLQKKEFTAPELTKITTITRTKIYEILQNLIRKGICNESYRDGQKVFRGIKPKIAIQNIVSNYELEFNQKKQAATLLEAELASLFKNNPDNADPLDYIEMLTDPGQIRDRWIEIQKNIKNELLIFTKQPYVQPWEENLKIVTEIMKKTKIKYRSIYEYGGLTSGERKDLLKSIEEYQKVGEEAKIIKELPLKLVTADEKVTMLGLNDPVSLKQSITIMVVKHPSFAAAQKEIFEIYWNKAISIKEFKKLKTI